MNAYHLAPDGTFHPMWPWKNGRCATCGQPVAVGHFKEALPQGMGLVCKAARARRVAAWIRQGE